MHNPLSRSHYDDSENMSNNPGSVYVVVVSHPTPFFLFVVTPMSPCKKR